MPKQMLSHETVSYEVHDYSAYFYDEYKNNGLNDIKSYISYTSGEKQPQLSSVIKTFGIISAMQNAKSERNIFQKFFAWITGRLGKENEVINKADDLLKSFNVGLSKEDLNTGNFISKIAKLANNDILYTKDQESLNILNNDNGDYAIEKKAERLNVSIGMEEDTYEYDESLNGRELDDSIVIKDDELSV